MNTRVDANKKTKLIKVIGDVVSDTNIYQGNILHSDLIRAKLTGKTGSQIIKEKGGAFLLYQFTDKLLSKIKRHQLPRIADEVKRISNDLESKTAEPNTKENLESLYGELELNKGLLKDIKNIRCRFGLIKPKQHTSSLISGYALWDLFPQINGGKQKRDTWRISRFLGYGDSNKQSEFPFENDGVKNYSTLVLDDAAMCFRFKTGKSAWPDFLVDENNIYKPDHLENIIYKMASPICKGDLWRRINSHKELSKILTIIVSISDLRKEEIKVSKGVSWEQTILDLLSELNGNIELLPLLDSKNLIVVFESEGALLIQNYDDEGNKLEDSKRKNVLVYDPAYMEGEWDTKNIQGNVFGLMSSFTASLSAFLSLRNFFKGGANDLLGAMKFGLQIMRNLKTEGHGSKDEVIPGFQFEEMMPDFDDHYGFESIVFNQPLKDQNTSDWMILTGNPDPGNPSHIPLYGLARQVALKGTAILKKYPHKQYSNLLAIERKEIESLTNISSLIREYSENDKGKKPLSIALFGPPGSGKSFTVEELAKDIPGSEAALLTFNLSQFENANELIGSFHQVRDRVLKGTMPIVFWDEFDSQEYRWLQYLLAPMQDGEFQEGQITHPLGKCVFVFAGATSHTFEQFGPDEEDDSYLNFKLKKGPDFKSRLSGYINILGPNRRQIPDGNKSIDDVSDVCFPIRRAILLRAFAKKFKNETLEIDSNLLTAFLEIDQYIHGVRSMEKLVLSMYYKNKDKLLQSNLPSEKIISLYVNHDKFFEKINRDKSIEKHIDMLAPNIHAYYRELGKAEGWITEKMDKDFENLDRETQESNKAAAKRIVQLLAFVGLKVVSKPEAQDVSDQTIKQIIENNIESLAEEEHSGWNNHQMAEGWKYGTERNDDKKIHPCLLPFKQLSEEDKRKDRNSVRKFPEILKVAGLYVQMIH